MVHDHGTPVLAHIHIPKTAGSSLRTALDTAFSPAAHLQLYFENDTEFIYKDHQLARFLNASCVKAFSSHFVRRFPSRLAERRVHYITFLREPVQQFLSYVTYTKKHYAAIRDKVLLAHLPPDMPNLSLRDCARWILAGNPNQFRNFRENYVTNFFARYTVLDSSGFTYADSRYRAVRLDAAQQVLSQFLFVGISERMDESWQLLREQGIGVGIQLPDLRITHENISSELRDDLSWIYSDDPVGQALLKSVAVDQHLYFWALDRFEKQVVGRAMAA